MEPEGSLQRSQVPTTLPYPKPDQSSPFPPSTSWRSILILSCHLYLGLLSGLIPLSFPTKTLYAPHLYPICVTCPPHLILLNLITQIIFGEECRLLSSLLCSFLHSPVTSSLLGPNILINTLFSNTLSLCSSLDVRDQVPHAYITQGKMILLYIWILIFLDNMLVLYNMIPNTC